jgi:hypothetical protein
MRCVVLGYDNNREEGEGTRFWASKRGKTGCLGDLAGKQVGTSKRGKTRCLGDLAGKQVGPTATANLAALLQTARPSRTR